MPATALSSAPSFTPELETAFTEEQAELLKTGLRFVRSSLLMEIQEPTEENVTRRETRIGEVEELERKLAAIAR